MDIDLARTFLAVFETGTFNRAAEQLNVTQSTVSTRIQNLEEQLGRILFVRSRAGTELTVAGRQFHRHAANLVRIWQQARQELVLPEHLHEVLSIGGQYSLWDALLAEWLPWMRRNAPQVAVRAVIGTPETLIRKLQEGELDIAVTYMPQTRAGLVIDPLLEDKLVLVSSDQSGGGPGSPDYIQIDWGPEFQAEQAMAYADKPYPALTVSHGTLGLTYILDQGGSGYFPERLVRGHLNGGALYRVAGAPWFSRPAYVAYPADRAKDHTLEQALSTLHKVAAKQSQI